MVERADIIRVLREARGERLTASQICAALNLPVSETGQGWLNFSNLVSFLGRLVGQGIVNSEWHSESVWAATFALPGSKAAANG